MNMISAIVIVFLVGILFNDLLPILVGIYVLSNTNFEEGKLYLPEVHWGGKRYRSSICFVGLHRLFRRKEAKTPGGKNICIWLPPCFLVKVVMDKG